MSLLTRFFFPVFIVVGFALPACSADAQWVEIRSPHFSVITDAGEKRGRDAAVRFEQMRAVFGTLMDKAKVNTPIPLQIIGFRSNKELRQFAPVFQGKSTEILGLFEGGTDRCFILLDLSSENPWQVVFHEYAHQLMNGTMSEQLDPWFEEGFAEYFRAITVDGKEADVGKIPDDEFLVLGHASWIKLTDLLRVQQQTKTYNESGGLRSVFYAESGIVVHYIYDNALLPKLAIYFDLVRNQHLKVEDAVQRAFGMSANRLDEEVRNYLSSGRSKYFKLPAPAGVNGKSYPVSPLSVADAHVALADAHLHSPDYQKVASDEFEAVLKTDPSNAAAWRGLGYACLIKQNLARAGEYFNKSAQLNSQDPRVLYYSAVLSQREAATAAARNPELIASMESQLEKSIKLDPDFADAHAMLAFAYSSQGKNEDAIASLRRAIELNPRNDQYRFNLAQLDLAGRKFDEGILLLRQLQNSGDPEIAARAGTALTQANQYIEQSKTTPRSPTPSRTESVVSSRSEPLPGLESQKPKEEESRTIASAANPPVPADISSTSSASRATFRTSSSLVLVDVITQDPKTGLPLNELKRDDFRMLDNGRPVPIVTFDSGANFGTRPLALWFVMLCSEKHWDAEGSGFMRGKASLLRPALDHLDKRDTVGVAHWCDDGREDIDLTPTSDRDSPITMIEEVQHRAPAEQGNRVGELSIQRLLRLIIANAHSTRPEPLPVLVFLYGDHSALPFDEIDAIVDDLLETSAFVYGINDGGFLLKYPRRRYGGEEYFVAHYLSAATAGQFFSVKPGLFSTALDDILVQAHFRYQLGFKPPALDGKRHDLKVALTDEAKSAHKGISLLHRTQYIPKGKQ